MKTEYGPKKNQNYTFRKERERIQEQKTKYTNCLKETKIDQLGEEKKKKKGHFKRPMQRFLK